MKDIYTLMESFTQEILSEFAGFRDREKQINNTYKSDAAEEELRKLRESSQETILALRQKYREALAEKIAGYRKKLNEKHCYSENGKQPDFELLKNVNLTEKEGELLMEQYKDDYFSQRAIANILKEKGITVSLAEFSPYDAAIKRIDDIDRQCSELIRECGKENDGYGGIREGLLLRQIGGFASLEA